ncbi:MAG: nitrogen fixation protein [gamma proteobacterium symbiont of Phacoides pectinatus]
MKIGITSQNFRTITGHAGKTRRFSIYEVEPGSDEIRELERLDLPREMAMHAYRGTDPHPIEALDILITGGCGQGFMNRLGMSGVRVYVTGEEDPLSAVRRLLAGEPLPPPAPHDHTPH